MSDPTNTSNSSSSGDFLDAPLWKASTYRSRIFRHERDNTNGLDVSKLGPTKVKALPWSPHLSALLCGIHDPSNPLSILKGQETDVVKIIYEMIVETWREHIILTPPAHSVAEAVADCGWEDEDATEEDYIHHNHAFVESSRFRQPERPRPIEYLTRLGILEENRPQVAFSLIGMIEFPPPKDQNVNMLPFIMGDEDSLPDELRPYYETIVSKCPVMDEEYGKVVYLTVSEGMVDVSNTQRRSGLHVEASPASGIVGVGGTFQAGTESNWGGGVCDYFSSEDGEPDVYNGGLYMASNMDDTCMLWDALITKDQGIVDFHGGGEHLRPFIGQGTKLKANELAWLTDRTPHEALPQTKTGYRQFFRLVTSNISFWFKQHSTANPKVPLPDYVQIIQEDKFTIAGNKEQKKKKQKIDHS